MWREPMNKKSRLILLGAAVAFIWGFCTAANATEDDYGTLNPNAPKETAQFDFLVGRWNAEYSATRPDGTTSSAIADWRIGYILNGYALQDKWSVSDNSGNVLGYGTMYRTYDATKGHWTMVEQTTWRLGFHHMTAEKVGDTMVMYETEETPDGTVQLRRVFYNIEKDRFDWRIDISSDDGKTWQEGVSRMVCTRVE